MKSKIVFPLFVILVLLAGKTDAQKTVFNAGGIAGLNFSELEGDGVTDYFGLNAGIIGTARFAKHGQLGMEILFSQNGEYVLPEYYPPLQYGVVRLNHIEVPLHLDWLIGVFQRDKFYDWNLNIGLAYTRLLSYHVETSTKEDVTNQVMYGNREAVLLQAGTTYLFTKNIGLNLKATLPVRSDGLDWTLAARMVWLIK